MSDLPKEPPSSEITPEPLYDGRRDFIKHAALYLGAATLIGGGLVALTDRSKRPVVTPPTGPDPVADAFAAQQKKSQAASDPNGKGDAAPDANGKSAPSDAAKDALKAPPPEPSKPKIDYDTDEPKTPFEDVASYNNFYEFGMGKEDPAANAHTLKTRPWSIAIEGEVAKPQSIDIDTLLKWFPLEERIYRMRCVEAWSMVIPWLGFPLGELIRRVEPTSKAKYVAFTTLLDPEQMPGQRVRSGFRWPYVEGLRMDEAVHPLTMLAVGLYGKMLPNQNGAPIRLVVPWKYGFKGIKSIVSIRFTEKQPPTTWSLAIPNEYGFYANVNPAVTHPRWSQASERRIGELRRRETLPFNGYGEHVAGLYAGMDLRVNY